MCVWTMGLIQTKSLKLEERFFGTALEWMFSGEARPTKMPNLIEIFGKDGNDRVYLARGDSIH